MYPLRPFFAAPLLLLIALPVKAQTESDPLGDVGVCYRATVTELFTGTTWQSREGMVTSVAEFSEGGKYHIEAYMGSPSGEPDMAFDGSWSIVGDNFISVDLLGNASFYVISEDLQFLMNAKEVMFDLQSSGGTGIQSAGTLPEIKTQCTQSLLEADPYAPPWVGTYEGVQPSYDMKNTRGEVVYISGNTIRIPSVEHVITLGPQSCRMTQTTMDDDRKSYSYTGEFLNHEIGPDGLNSFKLAFDDGNGSEPLLLLYQIDDDRFRAVPNNDNDPGFIIGRTSPSPVSPDAPSVGAAPEQEALSETLFETHILEGKKNVNVRQSPPSGDVVTTVDGGRSFRVHEVQELSEPVYLLQEAAELNRTDEGAALRKAANYKLENIKDGGTFYFADVKDDSGSRVRVIVPKDLVQIRRDAWYRSDDLGGWVFSGLCYDPFASEGCSQ